MKSYKLLFILIILSILFTIFPILDKWNLLPQKTYSSKDFDIIEYISSYDTDNDGIDDVHDIMLTA